MDKSAKMKNDVLEMLKQFMMGEHGKRMKPAAVSVEVVTPVKKGTGDLDEVLDRARDEQSFEDTPEDDAIDNILAKKAGVSKKQWEDSKEDEMIDDAIEDAFEGEDEGEEEDEEKKYSRGGPVKRSPRDYFGC